MVDRPFKKYRHKPTEVWARPVSGTLVVKTPHGGKIVLHEDDGDWEIIKKNGRKWGNGGKEFPENYEEVDE